ncbi:MAG: riboflavin biosynthesis protein RibD [Omnitrophica bacterium RIFCSPHIGHO2_02_FULL_46_11]|nr:MAG: riboflavin biosynthesis protein RibD [Omnitrophica bacterium RIFCSPHIGHO2_02_FULL_46_11]
MSISNDEHWMKRAIGLAEKGRGFVSPNPVVGACLVKSGRLISEGFHRHFGGPHAEVEAIRKAGKRANGTTLYVTLEPCSTYGKTPPCIDAIRETKISRVAIGTVDPNPKHKKRGIAYLRKAGIRVTAGILQEQAQEQIEAFSKWIRTGLPFVILKMAQSLDGKIASRTGSSRWISGPKARLWVHKVRASCDAVLVGKNTVLMDNPRLTVRNGAPVREPWRIVLDEKGAISQNARIFRAGGPVILACSEKFFSLVTKKFRNTKATILSLKSSHGNLDLKQLLGNLGVLGITSLLVEGGGEIAWSFFEKGFVDKVEWVIASKIIGGRDAKTSVEGLGIGMLDKAILLKPTRLIPLGEDFLFEAYVHS